ncbi:MAG: hypothetical protein GXO54_00400 [Chloroflexi bacterium]|nr:hypothetical protein [Chloroflexota bacterium]
MYKRFLVILWLALMLAMMPRANVRAGDVMPSDPPPSADARSVEAPDPEDVAKAQAEKLFYLPITFEQHARWEQELERQMMAL